MGESAISIRGLGVVMCNFGSLGVCNTAGRDLDGTFCALAIFELLRQIITGAKRYQTVHLCLKKGTFWYKYAF